MQYKFIVGNKEKLIEDDVNEFIARWVGNGWRLKQMMIMPNISSTLTGGRQTIIICYLFEKD